MSLAEDQYPVGDLGPGGEHEPFRVSVRARRLTHGRPAGHRDEPYFREGQDLLRRVRDNQSGGIRPCFIEDYLDRHGANGEVTVRPGAWNTGWHDGSGFTQWVGSPAQQQALTRLDKISQAIYATRRNAIGIGVRDPEVYRLLEQAHWRVLRVETSCNFFRGQAWLQRCHDDLDQATDFLDQAGSRLASHQPLDSRRP